MPQDSPDIFEANPKRFLQQFVTMDGTGGGGIQTKEQSQLWKHPKSPAPKTDKVMTCVFWDAKGVLLVDYLEKGHSIKDVCWRKSRKFILGSRPEDCVSTKYSSQQVHSGNEWRCRRGSMIVILTMMILRWHHRIVDHCLGLRCKLLKKTGSVCLMTNWLCRRRIYWPINALGLPNLLLLL